MAGGQALVARDADAAMTVCRRLGQQCTRGGQCCSGICDAAPRSRNQRRYTCGCPRNERACRQTCTAVLVDPENCGGCGGACDPMVADTCRDGSCACGQGPACHHGKKCQNGACVDLTCAGTTASFCLISTEGERVERNQALIEWDDAPCSSTAECIQRYAAILSLDVARTCVEEFGFTDPSLIQYVSANPLPAYPVCAGYSAQG